MEQFLPAGLDRIKNHFTNIGIWLAPKPVQTCFNRKAWWQIVYLDRTMEAALVNPDVAFEKIPVDLFHAIGVHARGAFGRRASPCQSRSVPPRLPVVDPWPLVHAALGAAIVSLRQAQPYPPAKFDPEAEKATYAAAVKGAAGGVALAQKEFARAVTLVNKALKV